MSNVEPFQKRPARGRNSVSNGTRLFVDGDGNSKWARRFRDIVNDYIDHLGGRDAAGVGRIAIVRRVATLEVSLEAMEATASEKPEALDLDAYQRAANTHRRLVESLGLDPKVRTIDSTVADYFSRPAGKS